MSDCAVAKGNSGDMVIKVKLGRIRNEVSRIDDDMSSTIVES